MKLSELKAIIRECIEENFMVEGKNSRQHKNEMGIRYSDTDEDPLKVSLKKHLKPQYAAKKWYNDNKKYLMSDPDHIPPNTKLSGRRMKRLNHAQHTKVVRGGEGAGESWIGARKYRGSYKKLSKKIPK